MTATLEFYGRLQQAFDHFNGALFDGQLPPCLITLRASANRFGYHQKNRFINLRGQMLDELGLHPGFFALRPAQEVLSTLVHEMVHHWQEHLGHPSKSNPHNREWAHKMREIGLEPSSTGLPEGRDTGYTMSHYIRSGGRFIEACEKLLAQGFSIPWFDRHAPRSSFDSQEHQRALDAAGVAVPVSPPPVQQIVCEHTDEPAVLPPPPLREPDRVRYVCPGCAIKAWAKVDTPIQCGACGLALQVP